MKLRRNSRRLFKFSIFQALILPVAGVSQLMFLSAISKQLSHQNLTNAYYLINLGTFLIFADFATIYNAYREASLNFSSSDEIKFAIVKKYLKQSLLISFANLIVSSAFLLNSNTFLVGIYAMTNAFTIPGLVCMHLLRGFGKDFLYLISFHSSWPMALLILAMIQIFSHNSNGNNEYLALLPAISLSIIGFFPILSCLKFGRKSSINNPKLIDYKSKKLFPVLTLVSGAVASQSDKIFVLRAFDIPNSSDYLICGILMFSAMSTVAALGSTIWGGNLSKATKQYEFHFIELLILGLTISVLYVLAIIFFWHFKILRLEINFALVLIMSITILVYSILASIQAFFTYRNNVQYILMGNVFQFFSIMLSSLILNVKMTNISLALIVLFSIQINIIFLVFHMTKFGAFKNRTI